MKKFKSFLRNVIFPAIISLITAPAFLVSIGTMLLSKEEFNKQSRFIFLFSMTMGQIVYSMISSTKMGIVWLPVLDGLFLNEKIKGVIYSLQKPLSHLFINHLFILWFINMLTVIAGLSIALCKKGHCILKMPLTVEHAVGLFTGIYFVMSPKVLYDGDCRMESSLKILIQSVISIIGLVVFKFYMSPIVLSVYLILITVLFCLLRYFTGSMFFKSLFTQETATSFNFNNDFLNYMDKDCEIMPMFIVKTLHYILSMVCLNLLMFSVAILLYKKKFYPKLDLNREFLAFSIANLASFISTGTVNYACSGLFILTGKTRQVSSIALGVMCTLLFGLIKYILNYVPIVSSLFLMQFMGFMYLYEYIIIISKLSWFDGFQVILFTGLNFINGGVLIIFLIAMVMVPCMRLLVNRGILKKKMVVESAIDNSYVYYIPKVLDAFNIHGVLKEIHKMHVVLCQKIVIDFSKCVFVDINGNVLLQTFLSENKIEYEIRGNSLNLYRTTENTLKKI